MRFYVIYLWKENCPACLKIKKIWIDIVRSLSAKYKSNIVIKDYNAIKDVGDNVRPSYTPCISFYYEDEWKRLLDDPNYYPQRVYRFNNDNFQKIPTDNKEINSENLINWIDKILSKPQITNTVPKITENVKSDNEYDYCTINFINGPTFN